MYTLILSSNVKFYEFTLDFIRKWNFTFFKLNSTYELKNT